MSVQYFNKTNKIKYETAERDNLLCYTLYMMETTKCGCSVLLSRTPIQYLQFV